MGANGTWYVSATKGLAIVSGEQYMLALDPSGTKSTYVGSETDGRMAFFFGLRAVARRVGGEFSSFFRKSTVRLRLSGDRGKPHSVARSGAEEA
jgi:hypothetical protein